MASTTLFLTLFSPIIIFALWYLTSSLAPPPPPTLVNNKRIILLIAHPDDESMFFSPTLQALTAPSLQNHLKILCLSTGNADGLGETRKKELERAALTLGVRRREDVFVMDDNRFKDGMDQVWEPKEIARVLASAFAPQLNSPQSPPTPPPSIPSLKEKEKEKRSNVSKSRSNNKTSTPSTVHTPLKSPRSPAAITPLPTSPRATIDVLITFDASGISSHPNHIALYHGAHEFLSSLMRGHAGHACPVTLYTLPTVNIVRKYLFILDAIPSFVAGLWGTLFDTNPTPSARQKGRHHHHDRVLFISDVSRYWKAREAMTAGHKSQMVWFRWGWIALGRYMVVNDLKREKIVAS